MVFKPVKSALSLMLLQTFSNLDLVEPLTNIYCSSSDSVFSSSNSGGATYFLLFFGSVGPPCFVVFCFPCSFTTWAVALVSALVVGLAGLDFVAFFFPLGCATGCFCAFLFFGSTLGASCLVSSSYFSSSPKPCVNYNGPCP